MLNTKKVEVLPGATGRSRIFLVIPLLTVALIGVLVLWIGVPQPATSVRVWGGPTDRLARWTGWIEVETRGKLTRPLSNATVQVAAIAADGRAAETSVELDGEGQGELTLDFGAEPPKSFQLSIREIDRELVRGDVALSHADWVARASRRGGYLPVSSRGAGVLRAAAGRGAFAVPFKGTLWLRAESPPLRAAAGVRIELSSSGASIEPSSVVTDAEGIAVASFTPAEHAVTLAARVALGSSGTTELTASVPVVPGALMAEREGGLVRIQSPIERQEAFVTIVSESGRWFGARVPLRADGRGMAKGSLVLPPKLPDRIWAVVESARGAPGGQRVGWPLFEPSGEPAFTFDARDVLVLDGFPKAMKKEQDRQRVVHGLTLAIGLCGALASAGLVFGRARKESRRLSAHLDAQLGMDDAEKRVLATPSTGRLTMAITLIALGFLITAALMAFSLR